MAAAPRRSVGRRRKTARKLSRPGLLLAAAAIAACGGGERTDERAHDLVAAFPIAEVRREVGRIDFGTPAAREHLRAGWHGNERRRGGETLVWSRGAESTLGFYLTAPRPLRAELRCAPADDPGGRAQVVAVQVNGRAAGEVALAPGLHGYSLDLPEGFLRSGENRLTFRYRHVVEPRPGARERRRLAVAWHDLRLAPLPGRAAAPRVETPERALVVPWGGEVAFVLELDGEARLVFDRVERVGRGAGRLVVAAREEKDQVGEELVAVEAVSRDRPAWAGVGRDGADVALEGGGRRLVRVALRAVPEAGARAEGGLRLLAPRLLVRPEARDPLPALALLAPAPSLATAQTPATTPPGDAGQAVVAASSISAQEPGGPPPAPLPDLLTSPSSTPPPNHATAPRPNVLVYLIDALRADRLGCYGNRRGLTPRIDAFATRALLFERAVAQAPWTRPAVASLFTGLGPLRHGVRTMADRLPAAAETLAERLQSAGWRTAAFSTNAHVTPDTGFAQGFDHFDFSPEAPLADALNRRFLTWLDAAPATPFFAYLHALDPHAPYTPPADLRARFAAGVRPRTGTRAGVLRAYAARGPERARLLANMLQLYDAEVAATDRSFGALLDALADRNLLDDTLIVLLADHGEEFGEHGALGHANNLHRETLDIPLIIRLPGQASGRRVRPVAQQIDVLPTILAHAGLAVPDALSGTDLVRLAADSPPTADRPAVSHLSYLGRAAISVALGDWKLIQPLSPASGHLPRLFHLARDTDESADVAETNPVRAAHLAAFLRAERLAARSGLSAERATLDEESRRALEALGYL